MSQTCNFELVVDENTNRSTFLYIGPALLFKTLDGVNVRFERKAISILPQHQCGFLESETLTVWGCQAVSCVYWVAMLTVWDCQTLFGGNVDSVELGGNVMLDCQTVYWVATLTVWDCQTVYWVATLTVWDCQDCILDGNVDSVGLSDCIFGGNVDSVGLSRLYIGWQR